MQDPWIGGPGQIAIGVAIGVILLIIPISLFWTRRRLIAWWDRTAVSMQFSTAESDFQIYRKKVEIDGGEQAVNVRVKFPRMRLWRPIRCESIHFSLHAPHGGVYGWKSVAIADFGGLGSTAEGLRHDKPRISGRGLPRVRASFKQVRVLQPGSSLDFRLTLVGRVECDGYLRCKIWDDAGLSRTFARAFAVNTAPPRKNSARQS